MNKIRLIFLAVVLIILIVAVISLNTFKSPLNPEIGLISEFKITQISGNGSVYFDRKPIERRQLAMAHTVDIKRMQYVDEIYLMTDNHASFEFYCSGVSFTVLPGSHLFYQPKTKELRFFPGEFLWEKTTKDKPVEILVTRKNKQNSESLSQAVTLSNAGRLMVTQNWLKIWNYSGDLKFNDGSEAYTLAGSSYLAAINKQKVRTARILLAPQQIAPERKVFALNKPGDSVVKFNWRMVNGADRYILRLYSSNLMENILYEKEVTDNRLTLDLLQFEDFGTFYWRVFPYDAVNDREGTPSQMGFLKVTGALLNKENILKPPELVIKRMDVNGSLVLIAGSTQQNVQLFINGTNVNINMDGTFLHHITFDSIGRNRVLFRAVSASGIETIVERYVNIFDQ
ncbi:MAG: hypothetical protein GY950_35370 [bacterium]|nr:hypothetical protein [bacterium]